DAAGRLTSITAPDGRQVVYDYDGTGNLAAVHDLAAGQSIHYGYSPDDAHLLTLTVPSSGQGGTLIRYEPLPQTVPVLADLGRASRFAGSARGGALTTGAVDRYAFSVRDSELRSTATGTILLGVEVRAAPGSGLAPAVPVIPGFTPLTTRQAAGSA